MKNKLLAIFVAALTGPLAAQAVPITYDFTGSGLICTFTGVGQACNNGPTQAFTGTVTIDVLSDGPSGPDAAFIGTEGAVDQDGSWVQSQFFIQWGANTFAPGPVTGLNSIGYHVEVLNNYASGFDVLNNGQGYSGSANGIGFSSSAQLIRSTTDTSWLSDLSFNMSVGLSPSFNTISFENHSWDAQYNSQGGYRGNIELASLVARPTSVPEPSTLALFGFALAGLGAVRRRRAA